MGDKTNIEWTDATWNPIRARHRVTGKRGWFCEKCSPGCKNCYASCRNANTYFGNGLEYVSENLADVELYLDREVLSQPLRWKRSRTIFPCSMTDMFWEMVPEQWIVDIFGIMALAHWHTFQVLTKRSARALKILSAGDHGIIGQFKAIESGGGIGPPSMFKALGIKRRDKIEWQWPLPNVWMGASVENQKYADERIPLLLQTPAAMRWLSIEPLLGPVDLKPRPKHERCLMHHPHDGECITRGLDWVVVGGESGPGARPMHPDWARGLRDQCQFAGVPFFFKQWGESVPVAQSGCNHPSSDGAEGPVAQLVPAGRVPQIWKCGVCGRLHGWQAVRVDEATGRSEPFDFNRAGKKKSGAKLDGIEHREYPMQTFAGGRA